MKKKWIIIIGITLILGAGILTTGLNLMKQDKNLKAVSHTQEWTLSAKDIKEIDINGLDQTLTIDVSQGTAPETQVIFSGETTSDIKKRMEKIKSRPDKLDLDLMKTGINISMKGKANELAGTLQIILGKDVRLEALKHTSIFADTFVTLPAELAVKTYPKTKEGEIETVEDDSAPQTNLKIQSDSGNISIKRR